MRKNIQWKDSLYNISHLWSCWKLTLFHSHPTILLSILIHSIFHPRISPRSPRTWKTVGSPGVLCGGCWCHMGRGVWHAGPLKAQPSHRGLCCHTNHIRESEYSKQDKASLTTTVHGFHSIVQYCINMVLFFYFFYSEYSYCSSCYILILSLHLISPLFLLLWEVFMAITHWNNEDYTTFLQVIMKYESFLQIDDGPYAISFFPKVFLTFTRGQRPEEEKR